MCQDVGLCAVQSEVAQAQRSVQHALLNIRQQGRGDGAATSAEVWKPAVCRPVIEASAASKRPSLTASSAFNPVVSV